MAIEEGRRELYTDLLFRNAHANRPDQFTDDHLWGAPYYLAKCRLCGLGIFRRTDANTRGYPSEDRRGDVAPAFREIGPLVAMAPHVQPHGEADSVRGKAFASRSATPLRPSADAAQNFARFRAFYTRVGRGAMRPRRSLPMPIAKIRPVGHTW